MAQQNATSPSLLELLDSSIWMNALRLVISANTMGTNAFLLLLFARHAKLRKRLCNQLILLNAIMDFVSGMGPGVRAIFQLYLLGAQIGHFPKMTCILLASPYQIGYSGSQITFLGLALDRLKAIANPLKYRGNKRGFSTLIGVLAVFFGCSSMTMIFIGLDLSVPSSQCSIAINSGPYYSSYWTIFIGSSTIIVFVIYVALLVLYFKHKSATAKIHIHNGQEEQAKHREIKMTTAIAFILFIYTISWAMPTFTWSIFLILNPKDTMRMNYVSYIQGYLTAGGCGLNLYIYLLRHAEIRRYARKMLFCCWCKKQQQQQPMANISAQKTASSKIVTIGGNGM